jgi:ribosomal protein S18 acetylase RimI-like enzyme
MSSPELDRMVANFVTHNSHLHQVTPGMTVLRTDDLVIANGNVDDDTFNQIVAARFTADTVDQRIAETIALVKESGQAFAWRIDPASTPDSLSDSIAAAGFPARVIEPGMAADLAALPALTVPSGLEIRRVTTSAELADYAGVIAANWDPPAPGVFEFYSRASAAALDPACQARYFVGYHQGVAVCTTEVTLAHGVAGIYGVVTLEAHRRRGFGAAITLAALYAARDEGFTTAVLQASPDGEPVYRKLGFETVGYFGEHIITT